MKENKAKKSFILFADFMTAVSVLTDEQAGRLFKQIFAYVNDNDCSKIDDPAIAAMFEIFRTQIDREAEKWAEKCRRNKEYSHMRKCYARKVSADVGRHPPVSDDNLGHPPASDDILNDNDSDNDSDNDNVNASDSEGLETVVSMKPKADERYTFDEIWRMYGKNVGNVSTLREKWNLLSEADKAAIFEYVPGYVASRPEVRYRRNFENFLSLRVWENEPLTNDSYGNETSHQPNASRRQSAVQDASGLMREYLDDDKQPDA
jgi:hypothetical protein